MARLTWFVLGAALFSATTLGCTTPQPLHETGGGDGAVCVSPQVACGGTCVDTTTDEANCGICGNACPAMATCTARRCICDGAALSCLNATGAVVCADGQADEMNCGGCGHACDAGEACADGECVRGCSDISDGDLVLTADMELAAGTYDYDTITIPAGVTLTFAGPAPVILRARTVTIDGTISLDGGDGLDSGPGMTPNGGDGVGGGGGGGGGGGCGFGIMNGDGVPGMPNGGMPAHTDPGQPMASEGGAGGLAAGVDAATVAADGGDYGIGGGGGGGGASVVGGAGGNGAVGGASFSDPEMTLLTGGGGGGGGGANGGGGGGGGGALRISADVIVVSMTGRVSADGGNGGGKVSGDCSSGGGGGGGGGMIWLDASVSLELEGVLSAVGGAPGMVDSPGGAGGIGRIQISAPTIETSMLNATPAAVRPLDLPMCP